MRLVVRAASGLLLTLVACSRGISIADFDPAVTPKGAQVVLRLYDETSDRTGELYAADSVGLIIRDQRLVRVNWTQLWSIHALLLSGEDFEMSRNEVTSAEKRSRLALVSRFPKGLSGPVLQQILAIVSQPSLDKVK